MLQSESDTSVSVFSLHSVDCRRHSYRIYLVQSDIAIFDKSNVAAQGLYKKLGYKTIGEISGFRLLFWSHLAYNWYFATDVLSVGTLEGNHQDSW